ncbi:MAG TPA: hypothetical protein PL110_06825 [Candidatus Eremiobacteraeota bacterium]|nr:MAG: hypothetical protein BWY64_02503 [bacterium ADurb.Bin363]HPZ07807.1 hypothetical protein [Candidatus Eremiobacteraeota bacterium]
MKKKLVFFLILFAFLAVSLNSGSAGEYSYTKGGNDIKFSLSVPDGWTVDDSGKTRTPLVLIGPTDRTTININVVMEKMPQWYRIDEETIEKVKGKIPDNSLESIKSIAWFKLDDKNIDTFKDKLGNEKVEKVKRIQHIVYSKEDLIGRLEELGFQKEELDLIVNNIKTLTKVVFTEKELTTKLKGLKFKQNDINTYLAVARVTDITPEEYAFRAFSYRTDLVKDIRVLSDKKITIQGIDTYQAVVDYTFNLPSNLVLTRALQTCIFNKGYAYIITGSALTDNFEKYENTFKGVTESLKFQ